jgi:hypothetical protein
MEKIHKKSLCNNWGSSIFFIANLLNFVLATAVFTIPFPMHEVGIILGTIILTIICFISIIACTFIIEALALKNSILKQENIIFNEILPENERESITTTDKEEKDKKEKEEDINEEKKGDEIKEETEIEGEKRIKEDENKDKEKKEEEKNKEEEINEENK